MPEPLAQVITTTEEIQSDGTTVTLHAGGVPAAVEAQLVDLYDTLHASLAFFRIFREARPLHCYVAARDGRALAIFVFVLRHGRIEVLNEMIAVEPRELERFVRHVFRTFPAVGGVGFRAVSADTGNLPFPLQRHAAKETYVIDLPATAQDYTAALGKSTRTAVRYQLNKVARDNPSFTSRFWEREEIDPEHVRAILRMSEVRISGKAHRFTHDSERIVRLARECGFVHGLFIDGRLVAGSVNYRVGAGVFGEAIGQDAAFERYGLGKLTVYLTVCESIARGARKFYLGGGRFDFKSRMLGVRLEMDRIEIYRSYGAMLRHADQAARTAFDGRLRRLKTWLREREDAPAARLVLSAFHRWKNLTHKDKETEKDATVR